MSKQIYFHLYYFDITNWLFIAKQELNRFTSRKIFNRTGPVHKNVRAVSPTRDVVMSVHSCDAPTHVTNSLVSLFN